MKISNKKTAFIFPGQGSQYKGMGKRLYQKYDFAKKIFDDASKILNYDIKEICFEDKDNKLGLTKFTQPSIFIYNYILDCLLKDNGIYPDVVAGHSLGEYNALVSSGCITYENALLLIDKRSDLMQNAKTGKMAAIINIEMEELQNLIDSEKGIIVIANYNSKNQLIISGEKDSIDNFIKKFKLKGIKRIFELNVSGAFHSPLMKNARINLEKCINSIVFNDAKIPLYQNYNPKENFHSEEIKLNLINQIDSPVRWYELINNMKSNKIIKFIEVGPKNVLTKLNRSIFPDSFSFEIESKESFLNV